MVKIELFDYLDAVRNKNTIEGMPLDELRAVLTGSNDTDYTIATDCIYYMVFKNKNTNELVKVQCVNNYYNLNMKSNSGKLKCFNIKKELIGREIPNCASENCAKCHVACIDDFYNGKITKK